MHILNVPPHIATNLLHDVSAPPSHVPQDSMSGPVASNAECEVAKATKLTIRNNVTVVEGGWMKHPVLVDVQDIKGADYFHVLRSDRFLARSLGLNMYQRSPWSECSLIDKLIERRDLEIGRLIQVALVADDPMFDTFWSPAPGIPQCTD